MLRKMNLNKTGTTGSGTTVDVPSVEETLHGLNTLLRPMDHITYDETSAKQPTLPLAAH